MPTKLELLLTDLASGDETAKIKALQWLGHEMDPGDAGRVLNEIRRLTGDAAPAIRYYARLALDEIARRGGLAQDVPAREEQEILDLLGHEASEVRLRGVLSAYQIRTPGLFDALTRLLRAEADPWVRASLVKAVAGYRRRVSVPLLMKYLEDEDGRVRANTVEALAELENPVVMSKILELIDDPEHRVQSAVLTALGRGRPGDIRPKIESMLASEMVWLQASAVYVIQETMPDWALDVLEAFANAGIRDRRLRGRVANLIEVLVRRKISGEPPPKRNPVSLVDFDEDDDITTQPTDGGGRPRGGKLETDH
jgi:HEAT repeat protein